MKKVTALLVAILVSVSSFGQQCPNPVTFLKQNAVAPCDGFLFSKEKELQVRVTNEENKILKLELENNKQMLERMYSINNNTEAIINKEIQKSELWRKLAEDNTNRLIDIQNGQRSRDWMYVGLGILITVGAGYALGQVK